MAARIHPRSSLVLRSPLRGLGIVTDWSDLEALLSPGDDLDYHEFWSRRDASTKQKVVVCRQFGRRYFVKLETKSGLFKTNTEILGDFPTVYLALQFVVDYAAVNLPMGWGERDGPIPARSTALDLVGIPFSELTPPGEVPGEIYVRVEMEMWRKLLKRAAKEIKSSKTDARDEPWELNFILEVSHRCGQAGLAKQESALRLRAARLGHPSQQYLQGRWAQDSDDLDEARRWYAKAAASGHEQAAAALAALDDFGDEAHAHKGWQGA